MLMSTGLHRNRVVNAEEVVVVSVVSVEAEIEVAR
jgi:hypothetical protein